MINKIHTSVRFVRSNVHLETLSSHTLKNVMIRSHSCVHSVTKSLADGRIYGSIQSSIPEYVSLSIQFSCRLEINEISFAGPFRCKICNKFFSRNTNLTKHMRIHEKIQFKRDDEPQLVNTSRNRNDTENMVISLDPFNDHDSNVDDDNNLKALPLRSNITFDQAESIPTSVQQNNHHISHLAPLTGMSSFLPPIHMPLPNPINIPAPKPSIPVPVQSIEPIEIEPEPESSISLLFKGNLPSDTVEFSRHVTGDAVTFVPNKANKEPVVKPKTFVCDKCPKKFATQSSLLNHKNIHSDIRNHTCTICNKSFIRKRGEFFV